MKIPATQVDSVLSNAINKFSGVLLYGPDYGAAQIYSRRLEKQLFPEKEDIFRFFKFDFETLKENDHKFYDAINVTSFSKGKKLVKISNLPTALPNFLKIYAQDKRDDVFLIMIAGDLSSTSSLRKAFEASKDFIVIPCYKDDEDNIKNIISQYIKENNIKIEPPVSDAISYMSSKMGGDRMAIISELEKLKILSLNKTISISEIQDLMASPMEAKIDKFIFSLFYGDIVFASENYNFIISEIGEIALIRFLLNYAHRLLNIKYQSETLKAPIATVIKTIKPPIFFKHYKIIEKHVENISKNALVSIIAHLNNIELKYKNADNLNVIIMSDILYIAKLASN